MTPDVKPFLDSSDSLENPAEIRARAARDGYLFFRGLLPREPLIELRHLILDICGRHGFLSPDHHPHEAVAAPGVRWREGDPAYMAAYDEIQRLEPFHALAHQAP